MFIKKTYSGEKEPDNTARYLITYADLITLLLGLFVILYASAQVDEEKFKDFSQAMAVYFKSETPSVLEGSNGVLDKHKGLLPEPVIDEKNKKTFAQVSEETENALKKYIKTGAVGIIKKDGEIRITLSEKLLFQIGNADISDEGKVLLDSLSGALNGMELQIMVDGHTDSSPIRTFKFESNWHLSMARATNVLYLMTQKGVPEENMAIRGYGAQRPIADNTSPEGKAKNRRVEITISELPQGALSTSGYGSLLKKR